jgi:anti-sigma B factor antagonist
MDSDIQFTVLETTPKATVVSISGHLGMDATLKIEKKFRKATSGTRKSAIVDLSGVTFITSYGVRMFLDVLQVLEKEGKKLLLVNPQEGVKEILVACELDTLAGIYPTKEAALAAV